MAEKYHCDVVVLGAGPGGYTAAFRAADLGKDVILVEKHERLGGVCLNVGCIPSKTLLHASEIIEESMEAGNYGISFNPPEIDRAKLQNKKDDVVAKLTAGLKSLAKARKVRIIRGRAQFSGEKTLNVKETEKEYSIEFTDAIIASGSRPVELPFLPNEDSRLWTSTDALAMPFIPPRLAVLGGGIIGMEMAQVYASLGSEITIIEMLDQIIPAADTDIVKPLSMKLKKKYKALYTSTKLTEVKVSKEALIISLEGAKAPKSIEADTLLVAVGRRPNSSGLGLEKLGIEIDEGGFIKVNEKMQSKVPGIYAIGDVAGNPMLAHKAVHEGKVAAEVIAGEKSRFDAICIPSVAYTEPEIAWVGYTEKQAKAEGIAYTKGVFPWSANGRALSAGKTSGTTKALFDENTKRLIGAGISGARAGDIICEAALAIEMGADAADIGLTIHAHPTFAETFALAAEVAEGRITDILPSGR